MGLTVHYSFRHTETSAKAARALVEKLRRRALRLPFREVSTVYRYAPQGSRSDAATAPDWFRWVLDLSSHRVREGLTVHAERAYAFNVSPGTGCEACTFGLLHYPRSVESRSGRRVSTRITGWHWHDFCKTQFASNPRYGGVENFLRGHVSLIALLNAAKEIGLRTNVQDEGRYAEFRNEDKLRQEIAEWNEMIAGLGGRLKDAWPGEMDSPILHYPDFERLEARGDAELERMRNKTGDGTQARRKAR